MKEPVQAQAPATPLEIENVFHSNNATAIAVVIGR
jgi:hypothetical protein